MSEQKTTPRVWTATDPENGLIGYYELSPITEEVSTGRLRWSKDGRLQQQWVVRKYKASILGSEIAEWRDVPTEGDCDE
jgi:hypothetical protein